MHCLRIDITIYAGSIKFFDRTYGALHVTLIVNIANLKLETSSTSTSRACAKTRRWFSLSFPLYLSRTYIKSAFISYLMPAVRLRPPLSSIAPSPFPSAIQFLFSRMACVQRDGDGRRGDSALHVLYYVYACIIYGPDSWVVHRFLYIISIYRVNCGSHKSMAFKRVQFLLRVSE